MSRKVWGVKRDTVRVTAILPLGLYQRLGYAAVDTRLPATEIVRRALEDYLPLKAREDAKCEP